MNHLKYIIVVINKQKVLRCHIPVTRQETIKHTQARKENRFVYKFYSSMTFSSITNPHIEREISFEMTLITFPRLLSFPILLHALPHVYSNARTLNYILHILQTSNNF